jgi:signal transduction histidine kinase
LAVVIALYNFVPWVMSRPFRERDVGPEDHRRMVLLACGTIVLDYFALTCAIWLVGGCRSPFVVFYLLHVIASALLLSRRAALVLAGLAYGLLVLLVVIEWTGFASPHLPTGSVVGTEALGGRFALTILVVYAMLFVLTCYLLLTLTRAVRSGERRIQIANAELSRLSEQRRDFLHIAMHNLKSPLGAATMFLENIKAGLGGPVTDQQGEWLGRSLKRLEGLTEFLSEMQTLSALENSIISDTYVRVDLTGIAEGLYEEYRDVAEEQGLALALEIQRPVPAVVGHERLLREAIVNYVTNALKYTPRGGHVVLRVLYRKPWVRVEVSDDGEGIASEDQGRLFGEFVRVIKPGSQAANVKGTGLGLSIVRRVVLAHDGRFGVESQEGNGSTFFIALPPLLE